MSLLEAIGIRQRGSLGARGRSRTHALDVITPTHSQDLSATPKSQDLPLDHPSPTQQMPSVPSAVPSSAFGDVSASASQRVSIDQVVPPPWGGSVSNSPSPMRGGSMNSGIFSHINFPSGMLFTHAATVGHNRQQQQPAAHRLSLEGDVETGGPSDRLSNVRKGTQSLSGT
jgi:hypothetical protein